MIARTHILIKHSTITAFQQKITAFPERYRNYQTRNPETSWRFYLVSMDRSKFVIQLVDQNFEPPRGRVTPDAPFIYIRYAQIEDDVDVVCWMQWQKWKIALLLFCSVFHSVLTLESLRFFPFWGAIQWLCLFVLFVRWLINNYQHDHLTIGIFRELIQKNFADVSFFE